MIVLFFLVLLHLNRLDGGVVSATGGPSAHRSHLLVKVDHAHVHAIVGLDLTLQPLLLSLQLRLLLQKEVQLGALPPHSLLSGHSGRFQRLALGGSLLRRQAVDDAGPTDEVATAADAQRWWLWWWCRTAGGGSVQLCDGRLHRVDVLVQVVEVAEGVGCGGRPSRTSCWSCRSLTGCCRWLLLFWWLLTIRRRCPAEGNGQLDHGVLRLVHRLVVLLLLIVVVIIVVLVIIVVVVVVVVFVLLIVHTILVVIAVVIFPGPEFIKHGCCCCSSSSCGISCAAATTTTGSRRGHVQRKEVIEVDVLVKLLAEERYIEQQVAVRLQVAVHQLRRDALKDVRTGGRRRATAGRRLVGIHQQVGGRIDHGLVGIRPTAGRLHQQAKGIRPLWQLLPAGTALPAAPTAAPPRYDRRAPCRRRGPPAAPAPAIAAAPRPPRKRAPAPEAPEAPEADDDPPPSPATATDAAVGGAGAIFVGGCRAECRRSRVPPLVEDFEECFPLPFGCWCCFATFSR
ncbi:hypothetical protein TYRP_004028 [Tyrophagus putrescentiae]|nr:hypothetical protein TYRP_004028 [Tyrophagus putrescentiae]